MGFWSLPALQQDWQVSGKWWVLSECFSRTLRGKLKEGWKCPTRTPAAWRLTGYWNAHKEGQRPGRQIKPGGEELAEGMEGAGEGTVQRTGSKWGRADCCPHSAGSLRYYFISFPQQALRGKNHVITRLKLAALWRREAFVLFCLLTLLCLHHHCTHSPYTTGREDSPRISTEQETKPQNEWIQKALRLG